ncbi:anthranilate synthase component I [Thioflexithrix psekupsensis]|uniref:Anthranilate synthase component 1 n=1 Tax=Thioflexithrix psekupsensis TaxID=1570016 RepID=A0A251XA61_9GAMM|nr:anthranilate synthase component I [Thioflexithrix psekupsensis]OUD15069.1 anthranilate synthase component I [Thioflexithrix psekupsensis]
MNFEQFQRLSQQGYNRIPVCREILADLDTPLSAYLKVANAPYSYLLESVQGGEQWGRYSIIGLPARRIIHISGYDIAIFLDKQCVEQFTVTDPLHWIEHYQQQFRVPVLMDQPRFTGGLVGYFGYDTVRYIEPKLAQNQLPDLLKTPDILLMLSDEVLVFDNLTGRLHVIVHADPHEKDAFAHAQARLTQLIQQLRQPLVLPLVETTPQHIAETDFISGFTQEKFEQAVNRAKAYIVEGDIMQVVLSQRLSIPCDVPPLDVYRILRGLNPSPYLYFFNLDAFHIVGSSPEILVRLQGNHVTVRPIAGTRPRGKTPEEDVQYEQDLLNDPKELAEHLMLIDLGRNDVGRVAEIGSVHLSEKMLIERYSHVMHIVSNVTGQLRDNLTAMDVLRATFPAGTLSGAPKIRAMEIIDELEPVKRGIYGGAVGYLSWQGDMDLAIAIRTAIIKDQQLHIQAGAGIVADSIPENEWQETMNKGRAMFRALALAAAGLHQG